MIDSGDAPWKVITIGVVIAIIGLGGSGMWLHADGHVTDTNEPRHLDSCTTITEPGQYELTADITDTYADTCIRIQTSDVIVLGGGHQIDGVGSFGSAGVIVQSPSDQSLTNVTVRDVVVTEWDDGIRYIRVENSQVAGTSTENNRVGLSLLDVHDSWIADNSAHENRLLGVSMLESSTNNILVNNTATNNGLYGFHLVEGGVRDNTLESNVATSNEFGFVLIGVHNNTVIGNTASENRIAGIWLSASSGNHLVGNMVSNRFYGIFLADRSNENIVENTDAESNQVGIRLRSSDGNTLLSNTIRGSGDTAILLISSDNNDVVDTTGENNARGITVVRSTGTSQSNNTGL